MTAIGQATLWLAFLATLVSIVALLLGHLQGKKQGGGLSKVGYLSTFVSAGILTTSIVIMIVAFFRKDFTFLYVVENHTDDISSLSWLYQLAGLWSGREGSFLFWTWLISLFATYVAWRRLEISDALSNMGLMVSNIVLALFNVGMLFSDSNAPFKVLPAGYLDPATHQLVGQAAKWGMNPLLQHWAMIIHPPMLFIGYAGMTIPFAFAIAALIVRDDSRAWVDIADGVTVFAWLFLGAGIGLGSVWAYVVLGWGGYWGWDPVENASLLPWLTGVALIHSFTVYKRRDAFKKWAISLSGITFSLVILGTFITRSGIVQSVHAFAPDTFSLALFLTMILISFFLPLVWLLALKDTFVGSDEIESLTSKEGAYYLNNVIMVTAGLLVAYLTVTSALPKWMPLGGSSIPISTYDAVARPVGVAFLAILALCPLLAWRKTDWSALWKRATVPMAAAAVIFLLLVMEWVTTLKPIYDRMSILTTESGKKFVQAGPAWYYHGLALLGFLVASVLIANTLWLFIDGARKRAEARGEGFGPALWSVLTKARNQSGGYLAHIGMGIILIGLIGSAMYVQDETFMLKDQPGTTTFKMADYTFKYQGFTNETLANGNKIVKMNLLATSGNRQLGAVTPGIAEFPNRSENSRTRLDASVISEPLRDIFVVFQGNSGDSLVVNVKINPLIWFTWSGFILLLFGTALAAWPKPGGRDLTAVPVKRAKAA
jgi:cytochrome c-type biogenesis protein CcmF